MMPGIAGRRIEPVNGARMLPEAFPSQRGARRLGKFTCELMIESIL